MSLISYFLFSLSILPCSQFQHLRNGSDGKARGLKSFNPGQGKKSRILLFLYFVDCFGTYEINLLVFAILLQRQAIMNNHGNAEEGTLFPEYVCKSIYYSGNTGLRNIQALSPNFTSISMKDH